ncbi:MAG: COR domain-containing protein [Bacteroidia bacterium]|nr:COR domain-containing protein [Bacteroidia bacterium]
MPEMNSTFIDQRIQKCISEKSKSLDLRNLELKEIPFEIFKLNWLEELLVGNTRNSIYDTEFNTYYQIREFYNRRNQILELPPEITRLGNLRHLDISENKITKIPNYIVDLKKLESFNLSKNNLISGFSFLKKLPNLKSINLEGCGLDEIPDSIFSCSNLQTLNVSTNNLKVIPNSLKKLELLKELDLSHNSIDYIPESILLNKSLEDLILGSNNLKELPTFLSNLIDLKRLSVWSNRILSIPSEFEQLQNLKILNIGGNKIGEIPPVIENLNQINEIYFWGNEVEIIPDFIGRLTQLEYINGQQNKISSIPRFFSSLSKLRVLYMSSNPLKEIPTYLKDLELEHLILAKTRLKEFPKVIRNLKKLEGFDVSGNNLTSLDEGLGNIRSLKILIASGNKLQKIPKSVGNLTNLEIIDLSNNQLKHLPSSLKDLASIEIISLRGNNFGLPEEIFNFSPKRQIDHILSVQDALKLGKAKPLHEAKLIFIGSGEVGKTSIIKRLLGKPFNKEESMTEGINIYPWAINRDLTNIKLNIWDFGGQEIMHATHRFFMTKRSIYVLVVTSRMDDKYGDTELDYWLRIIHSYAGAKIPIIICLNKCDAHKMDIGKGSLMDKYPNIVEIIETSARNEIGIDSLKTQVINALKQKNMQHVDDIMLEGDLKIKGELELKNKDYMSYPEYEKLCKNLYPEMESYQKERLIKLLHDLGVMLNFRDDIRQSLAETQVLNPEWVTKGVYKIITSRYLNKRKGILTLKEAGKLLKSESYPSIKEWRFIMEMMERFQLSFRLPQLEGKFFIPGAFPLDRPKSIKWEHSNAPMLKFQYQYNIMPDVIISRFISNIHDLILEQNFWRSGVIISEENCKALIIADPGEKTINIEVVGIGNKRGLLSIIRRYLKNIHETLSGIKVEEYIPLDIESKILYNYNDLLVMEQEGIDSFFSPGLRKSFSVATLLDGYESKSTRSENREQEIKENRLKKTQQDLVPLYEPVTSDDKKIKILFLASRPTDTGRQRLGQEQREILESIKRSKNRDTFSFRTRTILNRRDLSRAILEETPRIIHFTSSGDSESGIHIETKNKRLEKLKPKELDGLFELFSDTVECVILNACYTENQAKHIANHVPYVIGIRETIEDSQAIEFATSFYDALCNGKAIPFAFEFAKRSLNFSKKNKSSLQILISNDRSKR